MIIEVPQSNQYQPLVASQLRRCKVLVQQENDVITQAITESDKHPRPVRILDVRLCDMDSHASAYPLPPTCALVELRSVNGIDVKDIIL